MARRRREPTEADPGQRRGEDDRRQRRQRALNDVWKRARRVRWQGGGGSRPRRSRDYAAGKATDDNAASGPLSVCGNGREGFDGKAEEKADRGVAGTTPQGRRPTTTPPAGRYRPVLDGIDAPAAGQ